MTAKEAVTLIVALRDLTAETGTKTIRSQNRILQSLSDDDLIRVAAELKHRQAILDILSGKQAEVAHDAL
jgi:hypothetical protein